jgi:prevent-host-death family protein
MGATEFKARCLELMQAVHDRRIPELTITKRGRALAKLVPVGDAPLDLYGSAREYITFVGDVMTPIDVAWDALKD